MRFCPPEVTNWIAYMSGGPDHVVYTAHSVVRGTDGQLFDITPLYHNDYLRGRFIVHVGERCDLPGDEDT